MSKMNTGIDLSSDEAKIVCLERIEGSYRLSSYGLLSYLGDEDKLQKFIMEADLKGSDIRINIEDPSVKIRKLDLPPMPKAEMNEAVKWALKDVIDGSVADFSFRYIAINSEDLASSLKIPLLAFVIRTSIVSAKYDLAKRIGLERPAVIEPNSSALCNIFERCKGAGREDPEVLIDVGRTFVSFIVMGRKGIVFSRPLSGCSENNMVEQIGRDIGVGVEEASLLKTKYFKKAEGDDRLKNSISQFYSKMAIEIQRSIDGYILIFGRQKIANIHLCGAGAYFGGLAEYINQTIGINVSALDPFETIDIRDFSPGPFDGQRALFAVACGLAVD